jgi:hypothetical protein
MIRWLRLTALGGFALLSAVCTAAPPETSPEELAFFEKKIRPVLVAHCYQCHSAQAAQIKGGLVLDTREGVQRGGDSGQVVIPKDPANSLLIQALRHADEAPAMPPNKQLSEEVVADFERWIKVGAPDPRDGKAAVARQGIDVEKGRQFWSFVPPKASAPPTVKDAAWPFSDIDRFLLAGIESRGLHPVADADPYSLLRRLYLDLTGLPPTPEEIQHFVAHFPASNSRLKNSAEQEQVYAALVDKLLASSHFGERWGRHWLDVARFAETSGRQINYNYPQAWRYRDWVIAALNADKPFDDFVREQVAGDLLPAKDAREKAQKQIATGFLAVGPKPHSEQNKLQFQMDLADEQIDAMTQAFLGLTVACARCHDHKFDPIPQRDYYALAGILRSTETCYGTIRIIQSLNPSPLLDLPEGCDVPSALEALTLEQFADLKRQLAEIKDRFDSVAKGGKPTTGTEYNLLGTLTNRVASYTDDGRPKLLAMGIRERSAPLDIPLYGRGEIDNPGDIVPRGVVQVVSRNSPTIPSSVSGRLELADWLASRDNPLTARVFVNRVWMHLFGRGLVPTPDNFGAAGVAPDNQQLLDHLAVSFMKDGWSTKRLIRSLVLSRAYRQSIHHDAANFEADPDNTLVWRMSPRRLEAEVIRDTLLEVAGKLDRTLPAVSPVALNGESGSTALLRRVVQLDTGNLHRAVYLPVIRDNVLESLSLFDFADPSLVVGQRAATTVPAQSLFLLNSPFVLTAVEAAATRLQAEASDDDARLHLAYLQFLGRPPTARELQQSQKFLQEYPRLLATGKSVTAKQSTAAWAALCQALVASADFLNRP